MQNSVLIVEDHPLVCAAIRKTLEQAGYPIVGEASDGMTALQLVGSMGPAVVILDLTLGLGSLDGMSVLKRINRERYDVRVLVYTSSPSEMYAARCLQMGAWGFVSKSEPIATLLHALETVNDGYVFFRRSALMTATSESKYGLADAQRLTNRELQILTLLAEGNSNLEIANRLSLSNKTISGHKLNIMAKLGVTSLIELAEFAKAERLI